MFVNRRKKKKHNKKKKEKKEKKENKKKKRRRRGRRSRSRSRSRSRRRSRSRKRTMSIRENNILTASLEGCGARCPGLPLVVTKFAMVAKFTSPSPVFFITPLIANAFICSKGDRRPSGASFHKRDRSVWDGIAPAKA